MNYKNKYIKYKNKYLHIKNNLIQNGGSENMIINALQNFNKFKIRDLTDNEIFNIVKYAIDLRYFHNILDEIPTFIDACYKIAKFLNDNNIIHVIAPGDSPSKFIKFITHKKLCPQCKFITFSISNVGHPPDSDSQDIENYTNQFLQSIDDLDKTCIIDFISSGKTIDLLIKLLDRKFNSPVIIPENKNIIEKFKNELEYIKTVDKRLISYRCLEENKPKKHIIDITYFIFDHLNFSEAEERNTRCEPRNTKYITMDSSRDIIGIGCDFFVYVTVLYDLYPEKISNYIVSLLK